MYDYNNKSNEKQAKETIPTLESELVFLCNVLTAFHNIINSDMELKSPLNFLSQTCIFKP